MTRRTKKLKKLKNYREEVDRIDERILALLNARAKYSQKIGALKRLHHAPIYAPDREKSVLMRLDAFNKGPLRRTALVAIYREIMSGSLSLEKDLRIAYLGPQLTFTHQASVKKFGSSVQYIPCATISDVFLDVEHDRCDYGVVPVENSTEGAIYHTLDRFINSDLKICSEVILGIRLQLLSVEKSLKHVKAVYSNPQVFGQCRQWLESHLPGVDLRETFSTAHAAKIASKERRTACISSPLAATTKLHVLGNSIEDRLDNTTRFMVISKTEARPTKKDKTSIMVSIKDRVGGLHAILEPFRKKRINLTKIESRPSRKRNWEYYFFIDFEGHISETRVQSVLKKLKSSCVFIKVLGSYPTSDF